MSGVPDEQQSLFQHRRYSGDKPGKKSPERLVLPRDSFWFQAHAINDIREWRTGRERKPVGLEFASSLSLQAYLKEKLEGQVSLQCQNISSWKIHTREWPFSGDRIAFIHLIFNLECDYIHVLTLEMSQEETLTKKTILWTFVSFGSVSLVLKCVRIELFELLDVWLTLSWQDTCWPDPLSFTLCPWSSSFAVTFSVWLVMVSSLPLDLLQWSHKPWSCRQNDWLKELYVSCQEFYDCIKRSTLHTHFFIAIESH